MRRWQTLSRAPGLAALVVAVLSGSGVAAAQEPAPAATPPPQETCESCHARDPEARFKLADGTELSAWVDLSQIGHSVHGAELACVDCHRTYAGYPHAAVRATGAREYRREQASSCSRCHYAHFTRVLDGIHYQKLEEGNLEAPTCVDCHGSHAIAKPGEPRTGISQKCASCHPKVASIYQLSVHGAALARGDKNVPTCTDCHGAHDIVDPRTRDSRAASYLVCARCHGDAERMRPYQLSSDVLTTYLDDFHGSSNVLYSSIGYAPASPVASCSDCHGIHDIASFDRSGGEEAVRGRVVAMCRNCHRDAPEAFAGAWMSHSAPTFARTPLVWAVTWIYRVLIPFILLGLVMHILLDLWRIRPHRRHAPAAKED